MALAKFPAYKKYLTSKKFSTDNVEVNMIAYIENLTFMILKAWKLWIISSLKLHFHTHHCWNCCLPHFRFQYLLNMNKRFRTSHLHYCSGILTLSSNKWNRFLKCDSGKCAKYPSNTAIIHLIQNVFYPRISLV